jgi:hypothetical protein
MICRLGISALAVIIVSACMSRAADAQLLDKLKERAKQAAQAAEVAKKASELARNAVRCRVADTACIEKAKAAGKSVVLVDDAGKVMADSTAQRMASANDSLVEPKREVTSLGAVSEQFDGLDPLTAVVEPGRFVATVTPWVDEEYRTLVGHATFSGRATLVPYRNGISAIILDGCDVGRVSPKRILLSVVKATGGEFPVKNELPAMEIFRGYAGAPVSDRIIPAMGGLNLESVTDGVLSGTVVAEGPMRFSHWGVEDGPIQVVARFRAMPQQSAPACSAKTVSEEMREASGKVAQDPAEGEFVATAAFWDMPDGSPRPDRIRFAGIAGAGHRPANPHPYRLVLHPPEGDAHAGLMFFMDLVSIAAGTYQIGTQVVLQDVTYGDPGVLLENPRGFVRVDSAAGGVLFGTAKISWPRKTGPNTEVELRFRAPGLPIVMPTVARETSFYKPSYPFGFEKLLSAIDDLPEAKQKEIRHVYNFAKGLMSDFVDPGCVAQSYLATYRNDAVNAAVMATYSGAAFPRELDLRKCLDRATLAETMLVPPFDDFEPYRKASYAKRIRFRACIGEGMADAYLRDALSAPTYYSEAHQAAARKRISELQAPCEPLLQ